MLKLTWMVMLWDPGQMERPPEWVCVRMELNRVCHPLGQLGEASPDFDRMTSVRRWGQRTACEARLWELSGTWVEVEEENIWVCMIFSGHTTDWRLSPITASSCDCQRDCRTHVISRICHYHHVHGPRLSLCVEESVREADLIHVDCRSFWISHVPRHDFCCGPCCQTYVHLCLGTQWPVVSVLYPCYAQSACPTWRCCPLCWSDGPSNYRKGRIPHPDQLPMSVLSPVYQDREVACPAQQTQLYPDWKTQVAEGVVGDQAHWEGLKPQAPSAWPPPLQ